jgi:hypothetical protein
MKVIDIGGHHRTCRVVPRSIADSRSGRYTPSAIRLGTKISAPFSVARADGISKRLAVTVRTL